MKKKILSVALAALMALSTLLSAVAAETVSYETYENDFSAADENFVGVGAGQYEIKDGKCYVSAAGWNGVVNLNNYTFGDAVYEFDMSVAEVGDWGAFMFNKTNPTDTWDNSGYMFLVRTSGEYQLVGTSISGSIEGFENVENHYKIVTEDSSITVYFNNSEEPLFTVTDEKYSGGYASFAMSDNQWWSGRAVTFDNLSITYEKLAEETPDDTPEVEQEDPYVNDFGAADANFVAYRAGSEIADGKLRMLADGVTMTNLDNYTFGDAVYEFDMNIGEVPEWAGFMFNKTNATDIWDNSGYMLIVQPSGAYQFHQCNGGAHQIAGGTITGFENVENHYKIVKNGSSIKIYFNDNTEPFIDVTDENFSSGYVSFVASSYWGQTKVATFDNLSIASIKDIETTYAQKSTDGADLRIITEFSADVYNDGDLSAIDAMGVKISKNGGSEVDFATEYVTANTNLGITESSYAGAFASVITNYDAAATYEVTPYYTIGGETVVGDTVTIDSTVIG